MRFRPFLLSLPSNSASWNLQTVKKHFCSLCVVPLWNGQVCTCAETPCRPRASRSTLLPAPECCLAGDWSDRPTPPAPETALAVPRARTGPPQPSSRVRGAAGRIPGDPSAFCWHPQQRWRGSWVPQQVSSHRLLPRPWDLGALKGQTHGPLLTGRLQTDLSTGSAPARVSPWRLLLGSDGTFLAKPPQPVFGTEVCPTSVPQHRVLWQDRHSSWALPREAVLVLRVEHRCCGPQAGSALRESALRESAADQLQCLGQSR